MTSSNLQKLQGLDLSVSGKPAPDLAPSPSGDLAATARSGLGGTFMNFEPPQELEILRLLALGYGRRMVACN